jgi:hypothetical protein
LRANISGSGALVGIVATSFLVYKGWVASPEKSVQVAPTGPGELGMSASVRFSATSLAAAARAASNDGNDLS